MLHKDVEFTVYYINNRIKRRKLSNLQLNRTGKRALREYSGLELKKSIFLCAYFQSLDLQEYKIDQPKVVVTPINKI